MSEYAQAYGHLPAPDDSWALFLSLVRKASRFWARRQLVMFDAVADGVASLFSDDARQRDGIRAELEELSYPVKRGSRASRLVKNAWAENPPEEEPDGR